MLIRISPGFYHIRKKKGCGVKSNPSLSRTVGYPVKQNQLHQVELWEKQRNPLKEEYGVSLPEAH